MKASKFFETKYRVEGLMAQRKYPNEELCRFLGRNKKNFDRKKKLKALDIGCGSGSNIQPLIDMQFKVDAIDFSATSIKLCKRLFKKNSSINFFVADMNNLPFKSREYDFVVDVFSSYALKTSEGKVFLSEVNRLLKRNGIFFSFFPSKNSYTWKKANKNNLIDKNTLKSIEDKKAPYYGNNYPFRFHSNTEYINLIKGAGFQVKFNEILISF